MHQIAKACLKSLAIKLLWLRQKRSQLRLRRLPPLVSPCVSHSASQPASQPVSHSVRQSVSQSARKPNEWWIACHLQFLLQTKHSSSSLSALSPCLNFSCFSKPTTECEEPSLYNTYTGPGTGNLLSGNWRQETGDWRPTTEYSTLTCWLLSWNLR